MTEANKTLFQSVKWELVAEEDAAEMKVDNLCEVGKPLLQFFDLFGLTFRPVANDVAGNLQKLANAKKLEPELRQTLAQILQREAEAQTAAKDPSGSIGLLWFKRGLEYMSAFLALLFDSRAAEPEPTTSELTQKAYEMTLKAYHGWIMKKTFSVVSSGAPNRSKLLEKMRSGVQQTDAELYDSIRQFISDVNYFLQRVNKLLLSFSLEVQPLADLGPVPS